MSLRFLGLPPSDKQFTQEEQAALDVVAATEGRAWTMVHADLILEQAWIVGQLSQPPSGPSCGGTDTS